jgi:nucleoside-diphosphate-sugar epimerase
MRVLMTGSTGLLGRLVCEALRARHQVTGIDAVAGPQTDFLADIRDAGAMAARLQGQDAVVHLAALHAPHRERGFSEAAFVAINVDATAQLLQQARAAGVRRFVLASSTSVYGDALSDGEQAVWVTESLPPRPRDIYDQTKLAAEALCAEAFAGDFVTAALRIGRCFAEPAREMALYRLYRGVAAVDVAQAFGAALLADLAQFEVFNISAASPFLPADCRQLKTDAAALLRQRLPGIEADFAAQGWRLPDSIDRVYVIAKAEAMLGYCPVENYPQFINKL